jgi:hypothetical protein
MLSISKNKNLVMKLKDNGLNEIPHARVDTRRWPRHDHEKDIE